jgi:lipopolysaccharide export system permease protein
VLPIAQTKLYSLVISLRQKSPEFDIPTGEFYSGIPSVNLYVREKDGRLLKDMMIYDFSQGFENATVMVADSGRVQFTADNKYLLLSLFDGESFANLEKKNISSSTACIPYRRETFKLKEMLIDFNTEFNRLDESVLKGKHIAKSIKELTQSIDSMSKILEIQRTEQAKEMVQYHFLGREEQAGKTLIDSLKTNNKSYNPDTLFLSLNQESMLRASAASVERAKTMSAQIQLNKQTCVPVKDIRFHQIEWHRKFTLSFACLIFFFIGAPLGAIIRKGGLGTPVVISVIMFVFYYIIDNTGLKMAREGLWTAYQGMWLSSVVLLPIGIFLTYKAVVDAALLNPDQYIKVWRKAKHLLHTNFKRLHKNKIGTTL